MSFAIIAIALAVGYGFFLLRDSADRSRVAADNSNITLSAVKKLVREVGKSNLAQSESNYVLLRQQRTDIDLILATLKVLARRAGLDTSDLPTRAEIAEQIEKPKPAAVGPASPPQGSDEPKKGQPPASPKPKPSKSSSPRPSPRPSPSPSKSPLLCEPTGIIGCVYPPIELSTFGNSQSWWWVPVGTALVLMAVVLYSYFVLVMTHLRAPNKFLMPVHVAVISVSVACLLLAPVLGSEAFYIVGCVGLSVSMGIVFTNLRLRNRHERTIGVETPRSSGVTSTGTDTERP